jgi:predicted RNA-binding Zn ribbon-like protein
VVIEPKFKFIGGTLSLDFVNTVGGRVETDQKRDPQYRIVRDKLTGFDDLVRWSELGGALSRAEAQQTARAARQTKDAKNVFDRAIALREALYRICKSLVEAPVGVCKPPTADVAVLNGELTNAHTHKRLTFRDGDFKWSWDQPDAIDRILWSIADSAGGFFVSPALNSLRQCPGDDCGWLFLDASRNGSRQWCEMRICGNRAKLRRFRERLHARGGTGPAGQQRDKSAPPGD